MYELFTEIEIDATPEQVWSVLTDFASYSQWNPFIRRIDGAPEAGSSLEVRIQPSGAKGMTFRPVVLACEYPRELHWLGHLFLPGIFDGEHRFVIESLSNGTARFQQSERFSGILVPFFRSSLARDTNRGFAEMNAALKLRVEGKACASS